MFVNHISKRASGSGFLVLQPTIPETPGSQPHFFFLSFKQLDLTWAGAGIWGGGRGGVLYEVNVLV